MFTIFEKLGGEDAALEILQRRRGVRLSAHSVRLWKFQRTIPPVNALELMDECRKLGIPVTLDDFRLPERSPKKRAS